MFSLAKITSKSQTTIPREVREALHVGAGDFIVWELSNDGSARVRKAQAVDRDYLRALEGTLTEWSSAADEEAYRGL
jgi:bifunctional DNA-binding transcriptional regulator/antitoxin component of YhaV-PrlF toxin-antitoxin module